MARIKPPNIGQVAERAGVSKQAVSAVLSGYQTGSRVSEATRQRVVRVAQELGYRPNRAARALATGSAYMIGLWMSHGFDPFHAIVIDHLRKQVGAGGYELVIGDIATFARPEPQEVHFSQWPVDGAFAIDIFNKSQLEPARPQTPLVNMGAYYLETLDYVGVDLYTGTCQAVQHLLDSGCRKVACLVPFWANADYLKDARRDAYTSVMQEAGKEPIYISTVDTRSGARQSLEEYLTSNDCPDGVFCYNDIIAVGAYRALRDRGIEIPHEVALAGCDGIEEGEYLDCPLTTIVQPVEEMCRLAWEFLSRRMAEPTAPLQKRVLEPRLEIRQSSRR